MYYIPKELEDVLFYQNKVVVTKATTISGPKIKFNLNNLILGLCQLCANCVFTKVPLGYDFFSPRNIVNNLVRDERVIFNSLQILNANVLWTLGVEVIFTIDHALVFTVLVYKR